MSFGTFMDSLLFNVQADLGTLAGEVSHLTAPITPNFVFEHRQGKRAEALAKLDFSEEEVERPKKASCTKEEYEANNDKRSRAKEEKVDTKTTEPIAIETSKSNPVDNVDEVLKQLADMANDAVKRNEFMEQLKGDNQMMDKISTYMANEFIKDFKEEFSNDKELPDSIKTATLSTLISALQGLQKEMAPTTA